MASSSTTDFCSIQDLLNACAEQFGNVGGADPRFYIVRKTAGVIFDIQLDANNAPYLNDITFGANTQKFAQIDARIETLGATAPLVGAQGAGSVFLEQTLVFAIDGLKTPQIEFLKKLSSGFPVAVIVQTRSKGDTAGTSQWGLFGYPNALTISAADGGTGVARADAVGYAYTLIAGNDNPFIPVKPDAGTYPTFFDFLTAICENPVE